MMYDGTVGNSDSVLTKGTSTAHSQCFFSGACHPPPPSARISRRCILPSKVRSCSVPLWIVVAGTKHASTNAEGAPGGPHAAGEKKKRTFTWTSNRGYLPRPPRLRTNTNTLRHPSVEFLDRSTVFCERGNGVRVSAEK